MTNEGNRIHLEIDSTKNPPFHSPPSFKFAVHVPRSLDPPFFSSSRIREEGGDLDFAKFPLPFERNPDKIRPRRSTTEFPECSIQQSRVATWQFPAVGCRDDPSVIDHRRESGVSRCIRNLVHVPIRSEFRRRHVGVDRCLRYFCAISIGEDRRLRGWRIPLLRRRVLIASADASLCTE